MKNHLAYDVRTNKSLIFISEYWLSTFFDDDDDVTFSAQIAHFFDVEVFWIWIWIFFRGKKMTLTLTLWICRILNTSDWQISWRSNIAKEKTETMVPFLARSAHGYPQGRIYKITTSPIFICWLFRFSFRAENWTYSALKILLSIQSRQGVV